MQKNVILLLAFSISGLLLNGCAHLDKQAQRNSKHIADAKENTLEMYVFPTLKDKQGYRVEFEI